mgnify:CR=1 FL=1
MENAIDKISLVGFGNVGSHLAKEFIRCNVAVTHIYSRDPQEVYEKETGALYVDQFKDLPEGQTTIVCVPDDAIKSVIKEIPISCPVAYTSGATDIKSLFPRENLGVIYPLQTFSKGVPVNMFEVPFFIEASNDYFASLLFDLAWKISRTVTFANSEEREHLHIAAVFVNNFTNHLAFISKEHLDKRKLNFDHLKPLLIETVNKLNHQTPYEGQTGPARRGDVNIIEQHLLKLEGLPKELYQLMSESIRNTYTKK